MSERQRIMVVDDDQEITRLLDRALNLEGFDTIIAADGDTALSTLEKDRADLIILDIMMPGIDGLQTLDLIRERSNVPIIMLTARTEVRLLQQALSRGADDYVHKPFSIRSLVARVRAKLRRVQEAALRQQANRN